MIRGGRDEGVVNTIIRPVDPFLFGVMVIVLGDNDLLHGHDRGRGFEGLKAD